MEETLTVKIKEVMSHLGQSKSEKKLRAIAKNGTATRFKPKALKEIPCTCGGGEVFTTEAHPTTCARGRAIRYRIQKGLAVV